MRPSCFSRTNSTTCASLHPPYRASFHAGVTTCSKHTSPLLTKGSVGHTQGHEVIKEQVSGWPDPGGTESHPQTVSVKKEEVMSNDTDFRHFLTISPRELYPTPPPNPGTGRPSTGVSGSCSRCWPTTGSRVSCGAGQGAAEPG